MNEPIKFDDLKIRTHYDSDEVDVFSEFYKPVIRLSCKYLRAVGYFSAKTFVNCARELSEFIKNDGQIRLIIGCFTSPNELNEISGDKRSEIEKDIIKNNLLNLLRSSSDEEIKAATVLSMLISSGITEIKFAFRDQGIYHEKFGIFEDLFGKKIAFIGSINETNAALTSGMNHESFSTYKSSQEQVYVQYGLELEEKFEKLWTGKTRNTRIYGIDDESLELMKKIAISSAKSGANSGECDEPQLPILPDRFSLRQYQIEALKNWSDNDGQGLLCMATGTGKTLTAIEAVNKFKEKVPGGAVIIAVPKQNLAVQWSDALKIQGHKVIWVFESFDNWRDEVKNLFLAAQYAKIEIPCLVVVNKTFTSDKFQEILNLLSTSIEKNHLIVVDECHYFNSPDQLRKLPKFFNFRLGLSATPYDQFSVPYLDEYFSNIVFDFPLGRAIQEGFLTPYIYHFIVVYLDEKETELYEEITRQIIRIAGREDGFSPEIMSRIQPFLIKRGRIVGACSAKAVELDSHLRGIDKKFHTLFYCGDGSTQSDDGESIRQVELVTQILHKNGWTSARITAEEKLNDREMLLQKLLNKLIHAVVSIKVLDEGIDIPICKTAYLLASQSSDRQGVQRRGRVLRKADGKEYAELFDFLVLGGQSNSISMKNLAVKELRRARMFATDALNNVEALRKIEIELAKYGLELNYDKDN
jgi:superfamily II DNA or RNA helicase